jgi:UDP-N-acetylmuramoyl-L-alanyl-D-glutamate--2,6-diaminopimelate ligase
MTDPLVPRPSRPRTIGELLQAARLTPVGGGVLEASVSELAYSDVVADSRRVVEGSVFCCVEGAEFDGHRFAREAATRGAAVVVARRPVDAGDVPVVMVDDTRVALGRLAASAQGDPSRHLALIGVTGTNGKTTTAHILGGLLDVVGRRTRVIGTLTGTRTTPEAPELQALLADSVGRGHDAVVMEVSSHALALERVAGCEFAVGVFTNLGRDHLDFHGTQEQYFAAKARLFEPGRCRVGVVNRDDVHGRLLLDAATIPMVGFGADDVNDVVVGAASHSFSWRGVRIHVPLGGRFNVSNSLAAATAAAEIGLTPEEIADGLAGVGPVPGRFEHVANDLDIHVVVDYAHTPDGIAGVLLAARELVSTSGRVIIAFGCGGDRDTDKRPAMGRVAAELADGVVITSDNPRTEDPAAIIDAVFEGVSHDYRDRVIATPVDRREGIQIALASARPGDVVVIAGKGHELTQTIGATATAFDDRLVATEVMNRLGRPGRRNEEGSS